MAALMIQGCGSDVGKSVLVAGLCRLFANRGYRVRPFKPQNMSNNAAVTEPDETGRRGEIGRAQALQAIACRTPLTVHMNPVLLKPQSDIGAQVIVRGQVEASYRAMDYQARKAALLDVVLDSFHRLEAEADLVIVEGAGSPAEINLRAGDIANMGFALAAGVPVVLVGDIDRGHVIAALVGAKAVLDEADTAAIQGFIINKFRGDPALFDGGRAEIVARTGWPDLGLVPWLTAARRLPAEDAVVLGEAAETGHRRVKIAVPILRHIANFDDFDPLQAEPLVDLVYIPPGTPLPGDADLVILPGSKATLSDLAFVRDQGWDIDLRAHVRRGGRVLGICGGFQMLGRTIRDPDGIEGPPGSAEGLGLLDVDTVLAGDKVLEPCAGRTVDGDAAYDGFEMHMGRTTGPGLARPLLRRADGEAEGAVSADGRIAGCYVHRLFDAGPARAAFLAPLGAASQAIDHHLAVDQALDEIAAALETHLDIAALAHIAGLKGPPAMTPTVTEAQVRALLDAQARPPGSLGRIEDLAVRLALIRQSLSPRADRVTLLLFAGDHGLTEDGVSRYPAEVTQAMVATLVAGKATANAFACAVGTKVVMIDAGVKADLASQPGLIDAKVRHGTRNAAREPAMTAEDLKVALQRGHDEAVAAIDAGADVLALGEMGIGNSASAALLMHRLADVPLSDCVGVGAGHDAAGLAHKRAVLEQAAARSDAQAPFEVMRQFGGLEIAMMAGAIHGAADRSIPVLIDGFIGTAAALAAVRLRPEARDVCLFAHRSAEAGHARMLQALEAQPLLDLSLRLGEGTGALLAAPLVRAAAALLSEVASLDDVLAGRL